MPPAHSLQLVAPVMLENLPVGQITQDEAPDSLYVPTAQEEHESAPSSDHSPAEHTKQEDEAAGENRPAMQGRQKDSFVAPVLGPCVPASQLWQSARLSWRDAFVPASARYFPCPQSSQVEEFKRLVYVPAGHTRQSLSLSWREACEPASRRNLPTGQLLQL